MRPTILILSFIVSSVVFLGTPSAHAEEMTRLIRTAAAEGSMEGEVTGKVAEFWKKVTRSNSPLYTKITTIKTFSQPDCRRLNISLAQENVPTKSGEKLVYRQDFQMNVCSDGTPPKESVDAWEKQQAEAKKAAKVKK